MTLPDWYLPVTKKRRWTAALFSPDHGVVTPHTTTPSGPMSSQTGNWATNDPWWRNLTCHTIRDRWNYWKSQCRCMYIKFPVMFFHIHIICIYTYHLYLHTRYYMHMYVNMILCVYLKSTYSFTYLRICDSLHLEVPTLHKTLHGFYCLGDPPLRGDPKTLTVRSFLSAATKKDAGSVWGFWASLRNIL